jgi:hypothetical protein
MFRIFNTSVVFLLLFSASAYCQIDNRISLTTPGEPPKTHAQQFVDIDDDSGALSFRQPGKRL